MRELSGVMETFSILIEIIHCQFAKEAVKFYSAPATWLHGHIHLSKFIKMFS